ncbi:transposase [Streptomyces sp. B1I3]|nr:transposase [Streptomyces sp. B1I3]
MFVRPTGFDSERYKKRNIVERTINRLKGFRAVATRYEKRAYIYLGTVAFAALMIWLTAPEAAPDECTLRFRRSKLGA